MAGQYEEAVGRGDSFAQAVEMAKGQRPESGAEIPTQLDVLRSNVDRLEHQIGRMFEALRPVSKPEQDAPTEATVSPVAQTMYGGQLHEMNYRLGRVAQLIIEQIDRLEV